MKIKRRERVYYVYLEWAVSHFQTQRHEVAPEQGKAWFRNEEVMITLCEEYNYGNMWIKKDKEILWYWWVVVMSDGGIGDGDWSGTGVNITYLFC